MRASEKLMWSELALTAFFAPPALLGALLYRYAYHSLSQCERLKMAESAPQPHLASNKRPHSAVDSHDVPDNGALQPSSSRQQED
jgi:hypothetical protein